MKQEIVYFSKSLSNSVLFVAVIYWFKIFKVVLKVRAWLSKTSEQLKCILQHLCPRPPGLSYGTSLRPGLPLDRSSVFPPTGDPDSQTSAIFAFYVFVQVFCHYVDIYGSLILLLFGNPSCRELGTSFFALRVCLLGGSLREVWVRIVCLF